MGPMTVQRAIAGIVGRRSLVGLSVAGSLALQTIVGHAAPAGAFPITANPAAAQLVYPTNSVQVTFTATPPEGFFVTGWATTTSPQYGTIALGPTCVGSATSTCTVTYTQQATPVSGPGDSALPLMPRKRLQAADRKSVV